jgi:hypothetical protein
MERFSEKKFLKNYEIEVLEKNAGIYNDPWDFIAIKDKRIPIIRTGNEHQMLIHAPDLAPGLGTNVDNLRFHKRRLAKDGLMKKNIDYFTSIKDYNNNVSHTHGIDNNVSHTHGIKKAGRPGNLYTFKGSLKLAGAANTKEANYFIDAVSSGVTDLISAYYISTQQQLPLAKTNLSLEIIQEDQKELNKNTEKVYSKILKVFEENKKNNYIPIYYSTPRQGLMGRIKHLVDSTGKSEEIIKAEVFKVINESNLVYRKSANGQITLFDGLVNLLEKQNKLAEALSIVRDYYNIY